LDFNADKIKLVFFDLDGTLIGKSGTISDTDLASLVALKKRGIKIAIASGRPIIGIRNLQQLIGFNGVSSLGAGSIIYDPIKDSVIESTTFDFDKYKEMWTVLREHGFYVEAHTVQEVSTGEPHPFAVIHSEYMDEPVIVRSEEEIFLKGDFIKCIVAVNSEKELTRLRTLLSTIADISVGVASGAKHPGVFFANITDSRADRKLIFQKILQIENVNADEVMSFGDSESDKIFIEMAGIGVAMKDAPESVKQVANIICGSVEESAVSKVLQQILLKTQLPDTSC